MEVHIISGSIIATATVFYILMSIYINRKYEKYVNKKSKNGRFKFYKDDII